MRKPRASSSAPMDAAAIPLPSPETTPPVTKMYLVLIGHASGWLREFGRDRGAVRAALLAGRGVLAVAKKRVRVSTQLTNALRGYFFSASSCSTRATSSGRSTPRWGLVV